MEDKDKKKREYGKTPEEIVEETMQEMIGATNINDSEEQEKDVQNDSEENADEIWSEDPVFEEAEAVKAKKSINKKKRNKILAITGAVIVGLYLAVSLYFNYHFYPYQKINGVDVSGKTPEQVEAYMEEQVKGYKLKLIRNDGKTEEIVGKDISAKYVPDDDVKNIMKKQNALLWITSLWNHKNIEAPVGVHYDENKLKKQIEGLDLMVEENMTESVSAHPEFQDTQFEIVDAVYGTRVDVEDFNKNVREAINGFASELDLEKTGCYVDPKFNKDDEEVVAARDAMNSYLGAKITYNFDPYTEVVDSSVISQWIAVNEEMEVTFNQEAVKAFIQTLAEKYDTYGKSHSFTTGTGATVEVVAKGYGWRINRDEEYKQLTDEISKGEQVEREPVYLNRAISHEGNDFGTTYAEVDLTGQQIFFFKDGQQILNSPCVTGNTAEGHGTPDGIYTLAYKTTDTVLRGKKMPDGTYEYESPVSFWMPFNGGIGFHDASWRNNFGGTIYQNNGSHGCVNLPYDAASTLYNNISAGTPVICHY